MNQRRTSYLEILEHNILRIFLFIIVIYSAIIICLYQHYNNKIEVAKSQILHDNYRNIQKISLHKINTLVQQLSSTLQNKDISIKSSLSDLEVCYKDTKCTKYSLFRFGALLDTYIPESIYYQIELNKQFLYSNTKVQRYQIDKVYHLNDSYQLNISLAINDVLLETIATDIKRPFWILCSFAVASILLLYIWLKALSKCYNRGYASYYHDKYTTETARLQSAHQQELKDCKSSLMQKIWDLDFNKQKDLEINCLFAQEANRVALSVVHSSDQVDVIKDRKLKIYGDKLPCSIVLFQDNHIEEINTSKLIDLFTDRFNKENDNISVVISSEIQIVRFTSQAALYQVIYSMINYLIFLLHKQSVTVKHNIKLTISSIEQRIQLRWEYDGLPIVEEKELFKLSNHFFQTHANPFLLNLHQIFSILRMYGFDCKVYHRQYNTSNNKWNIIEMTEANKDFRSSETKLDNIISLLPVINKKK